MFSQFLLGVLLMTSLVMLVLLVSPQPNRDIRTRRLPVVGIMVALVVLFLALVSGLIIPT